MLDLYLLVIGKDQAECGEFNSSGLDCEVALVANPEDRPMAVVANEHLRQCTRAVFGLIHPDVSFGLGGLQAFCDCAASGKVCGIVGRGLDGEYRWCTAGAVPVSTLDDCSVFFRPDSGLRFDEEVPDPFQGYVTDLCLQAHRAGIPVVVPEAQANHVGKRFFTDYEARQYGWNACLERIRQKWPGVEFVTT